MLLSIALCMTNEREKQDVQSWLDEIMSMQYQVICSSEASMADIYFVEIEKLFDWIKIRRIQRKNKECMIIPIIATELVFSSTLAIELKLQSLLVKPINRNDFMRVAKKLKKSFIQKQNLTLSYTDLYEQVVESDITPYQEAFLRSLVRGEISSEQELIEASAFVPKSMIPNVVLLLQGFIKNVELVKEPAPLLIKKCVKQQFSRSVSHVSFLPFEKNLLILMRVPDEYSSFKDWDEGVNHMLQVIHKLESEYSIQIYFGIGEIYQDPLLLHHSYGQARKARRLPAVKHLQLRFFEDITKNPSILKLIDYIANHYQENITMSLGAELTNFSTTYFSRMFKRETGRSFVEYVTFIRLLKSLPLIRRTNQTFEQISAETGFNTPNYYSSIFKKYVGITPSEYRMTKEIIFK
ncbi:MAG: helix-turn-helix domain-containing protein [Bacillus sp. (in: firmicutes)]